MGKATNKTATALLDKMQDVIGGVQENGTKVMNMDVMTAGLYLAISAGLNEKAMTKEMLLADIANAATEIYDDLVDQGKDD